jgi:hypothetical protein
MAETARGRPGEGDPEVEQLAGGYDAADVTSVSCQDRTATPLSAEDARALTDRIKTTAERLLSLLLEAHERRAWEALGYDSWRTYAVAEFGMSKSRAYQLLDQAKVLREIEAAAGSTDVELTEAEARDIKPMLGEVAAEIRERVAEGPPEQVADVVKSVVKEQRSRRRRRPPRPTAKQCELANDAAADRFAGRTRRIDPARIINEIVMSLEGTRISLGLLDDPASFESLSRDDLTYWTSSLTESIQSLNRFNRKLKELIKRWAEMQAVYEQVASRLPAECQWMAMPLSYRRYVEMGPSPDAPLRLHECTTRRPVERDRDENLRRAMFTLWVDQQADWAEEALESLNGISAEDASAFLSYYLSQPGSAEAVAP